MRSCCFGWADGSWERSQPSLDCCKGGVFGDAFLIFWLGGWTVGGIFAALTAYRIFRPTVPEALQLRRGSIAYDSGIPPLELNTQTRKSTREYWSLVFAKRIRADFERPQLQTLRLRETESGNRLTIDLGAQRIELASQVSEVEREWLARLLAKRYGLAQALPGREVADA
ncbi:hypothetical protein CQ14_20275 [Bradyrhizobium lablabi]|uniref:Uncharacterized protein n=1 Tax=Bradyrhizobium lablabi TaxID=722472 RepID=A0A0R3N404_9BRAD|nr:hypothetical protein [Bradyrhizobium lablabi]KRR26732.1 hypothetical protein CQ14_20275 [Bradyrhizobium lablabi]